MVGQFLHPGWNVYPRFHFLLALTGVVEEEIDQDRVHGGVGVTLDDLSPDQMDAPDAASADLDLAGLARSKFFTGFDAALQPGTVE